MTIQYSDNLNWTQYYYASFGYLTVLRGGKKNDVLWVVRPHPYGKNDLMIFIQA